jgi:hypothetical protein
MTDLRVSTSRELSVDLYRKKEVVKNKYYFKKEIPQHVIEHKARYKRLLSGGEAH